MAKHTIHRMDLRGEEVQTFRIHKGCKILKIMELRPSRGLTPKKPWFEMWFTSYIGVPESDFEERKLFIVGTGHEIPIMARHYVDSIAPGDGTFVWHFWVDKI